MSWVNGKKKRGIKKIAKYKGILLTQVKMLKDRDNILN